MPKTRNSRSNSPKKNASTVGLVELQRKAAFEKVKDIFCESVDEAVIKIVLEECDWKDEEAVEKLLVIAESSAEQRKYKSKLQQIAEGVFGPLHTASSLSDFEKVIRPPSRNTANEQTHQSVESQSQNFSSQKLKGRIGVSDLEFPRLPSKSASSKPPSSSSSVHSQKSYNELVKQSDSPSNKSGLLSQAQSAYNQQYDDAESAQLWEKYKETYSEQYVTNFQHDQVSHVTRDSPVAQTSRQSQVLTDDPAILQAEVSKPPRSVSSRSFPVRLLSHSEEPAADPIANILAQKRDAAGYQRLNSSDLDETVLMCISEVHDDLLNEKELARKKGAKKRDAAHCAEISNPSVQNLINQPMTLPTIGLSPEAAEFVPRTKPVTPPPVTKESEVIFTGPASKVSKTSSVEIKAGVKNVSIASVASPSVVIGSPRVNQSPIVAGPSLSPGMSPPVSRVNDNSPATNLTGSPMFITPKWPPPLYHTMARPPPLQPPMIATGTPRYVSAPPNSTHITAGAPGFAYQAYTPRLVYAVSQPPTFQVGHGIQATYAAQAGVSPGSTIEEQAVMATGQPIMTTSETRLISPSGVGAVQLVSPGLEQKLATIQTHHQIGKKVMIILRGLPGSGKSLLARSLQMNGITLSTDDYFMNGPRYEYNPDKLTEAHQWNRERAKEAMKMGQSPVIIDNTNTQKWEFKPYVSMANNFKYHVEIMEPDTPWKFSPGECAKRTVHGVPKDQIQRMLSRYEKNITVDMLMNKKKAAFKKEEHAEVTVKEGTDDSDRAGDKRLPMTDSTGFISIDVQKENQPPRSRGSSFESQNRNRLQTFYRGEDLKMYKQRSAESDSDSLSMENLSFHSEPWSNTSSRNASPKTLRPALRTPNILQKMESPKPLTNRKQAVKPQVKKVKQKAIKEIEAKLSEESLDIVNEIISEHVKDKILSVGDVNKLEDEVKALVAISIAKSDEIEVAEELIGLKLHDLINKSFEVDEQAQEGDSEEDIDKDTVDIDARKDDRVKATENDEGERDDGRKEDVVNVEDKANVIDSKCDEGDNTDCQRTDEIIESNKKLGDIDIAAMEWNVEVETQNIESTIKKVDNNDKKSKENEKTVKTHSWKDIAPSPTVSSKRKEKRKYERGKTQLKDNDSNGNNIDQKLNEEEVSEGDRVANDIPHDTEFEKQYWSSIGGGEGLADLANVWESAGTWESNVISSKRSLMSPATESVNGDSSKPVATKTDVTSQAGSKSQQISNDNKPSADLEINPSKVPRTINSLGKGDANTENESSSNSQEACTNSVNVWDEEVKVKPQRKKRNKSSNALQSSQASSKSSLSSSTGNSSDQSLGSYENSENTSGDKNAATFEDLSSSSVIEPTHETVETCDLDVDNAVTLTFDNPVVTENVTNNDDEKVESAIYKNVNDFENIPELENKTTEGDVSKVNQSNNAHKMENVENNKMMKTGKSNQETNLDNQVQLNCSLQLLKESYADTDENKKTAVYNSDDEKWSDAEENILKDDADTGKDCDDDAVKKTSNDLEVNVAGLTNCAENEDDKTKSNGDSKQSDGNVTSKPKKKRSKKKSGQRHMPFINPEDKKKFMTSDWITLLPKDQSVTVISNEMKSKVVLMDKETCIEVQFFNIVRTLNTGGFVDSSVKYLVGKPWKIVNTKTEHNSNEIGDEKVSEIHCLDKSTSTDDFSVLSKENGIEFLQASFPELPLEDVQCVFETCDSNVEWAVDLLLDWKYSSDLTNEEKEQFASGIKKLRKCASPVAVAQFSEESKQGPGSLLDMCFGIVEDTLKVPRGDIEKQIIETGKVRLNRLESEDLTKVRRRRSSSLSESPNANKSLEGQRLASVLRSLSSPSATERYSFDGGVSRPSEFSPIGIEKSSAFMDKTIHEIGENDNSNDAEITKRSLLNDGATDVGSDAGIDRPDAIVAGGGEDDAMLDMVESGEPVVISIPVDVVNQLEDLFGAIDGSPRGTEDISVVLDHRTAFLLYDCVKESIAQSFAASAQTQQQLLQDEEFARKLQQEENKRQQKLRSRRLVDLPSTRPPRMRCGARPVGFSIQGYRERGWAPVERRAEYVASRENHSSLVDIMKEEQRQQESEQKVQQLLNVEGEQMAVRLRKDKLYETFPTVDRTYLDDVFQANCFGLSDTIDMIKCNLGQEPAPVSSTIDDTDRERRQIEATKYKSMQDMLDSYLYQPMVHKDYQDGAVPEYEDYRGEASVHMRLRHECFQKAREAYKRNMKQVATFYSQQGHLHTQKIKEANMRASQQILAERNTDLEKRHTLDLHGLHVDEAIAALERILPEKERNHWKYIIVITGRGSHSRGGVARLRPKIIEHLSRANYSFTEVQTGVLKVNLKYRPSDAQ